jgi:hypothetical protein
MSEEGEGVYQIDATLGNLSLTVQGEDKEWVKETFDDEWQRRLQDAGEMSDAIRNGSRAHK